MEVIRRSARGYKQDPTKYLDFKRFSKRCSDFVLVEAAFEEAHQWEQFDLTDSHLDYIKKKKIVRLEFEEPNKFFIGDNPDKYDGQFYKIFTLCPYTAKWLNKKHHNKKRIPIFFPFNEMYIPKETKKKYDVIYTGHIVSRSVLNDLKTISKFNYKLVSNSSSNLVTNKGVSYEEKMRLISESKITVAHNVLYPRLYHLINIWRIPDYRKNKAFMLIPPWYKPWKYLVKKYIIVPQLKSRIFEAAFGKSLILCKRDAFNVIEEYFEPDKEFVYFDNDLEEKIKHILKNYEKYQEIAENAYKKAVKNYSTEAFAIKYLQSIK